MTLWDVITDNSSLPVGATNTFWNHLNNQAAETISNVFESSQLKIGEYSKMSVTTLEEGLSAIISKEEGNGGIIIKQDGGQSIIRG